MHLGTQHVTNSTCIIVYNDTIKMCTFHKAMKLSTYHAVLLETCMCLRYSAIAEFDLYGHFYIKVNLFVFNYLRRLLTR